MSKSWISSLSWASLGVVFVLTCPSIPERPQGTSREEETYLADSWFEFQRTYPFGSYPENARRKAWASIPRRDLQFVAPESMAWRSIGPTPTYPRFFSTGLASGRIYAIAISPANPQLILVGGNTGGIWRSTDGGNSFIPVSDEQVDLAVGSIAFSESDPSIAYAGMGGGVGSGSGFYMGTGILKSTDAGATWKRINHVRTRHLRIWFSRI